ncbi:MAG TPA: 3-deoxy-7-phosphoheptulonate synthase, partial [Pilimelia sp.]|nr:3-deoxy-7-phosphoheptulonate synthase [Pilimelia sp.]
MTGVADLRAGAPAPVVLGALPTRADLERRAPLGPLRDQVARHRHAVRAVLDGRDDRLLVIVGPCSVHDPAAGLEYAARLADAADACGDDLLVVLRAYLEKPRSVLGWRGLVPDPDLDGTGDLARGRVTARRFL